MVGSYWLDRLNHIVWIVSAESYRYPSSWIRSEKLGLYALAGIMGDIGLLLDGWDGRTGWGRGGTRV